MVSCAPLAIASVLAMFRTMRLDRHQLAFLALCVLDEARDSRAPARSAGLRLALAMLYILGDRDGEWFDREPYEAFWRALGTCPEGETSAASFGRSQQLTASLNAIARAAGVPLDVETLQAIRRARGAPE